MSTLTFNVNGIPGAQGSKRHVGNGVMKESSKKVTPWRSDVKAAAEAAAITQGVPTFTGPVMVHINFYFARPKSHYRTGRNAHILRDDAPEWVTSRAAGDLDKLMRSTFDALTASGVIADDSLIVCSRSAKNYDYQIQGADIGVWDLRVSANATPWRAVLRGVSRQGTG